MEEEVTRMGRRGTIVIPAALRSRLGLRDGSLLLAEERDGGVLLRPAAVLPLESYSRERKAEFLLANAVDDEDYRKAARAVKAMGLDPAKVARRAPSGR